MKLLSFTAIIVTLGFSCLSVSAQDLKKAREAIVLAPPNWNQYGQPNLLCNPGYTDSNGAHHDDFYVCFVAWVINSNGAAAINSQSHESSIPDEIKIKVLPAEEVANTLNALTAQLQQTKAEVETKNQDTKKAIDDVAKRPMQISDNERNRIIQDTTAAVLKELQVKGALH